MNEIHLGSLDLNLLVVFRVLMEEGNVNRAAEKLNRTPSAISHALGRLREQLSDPLLVRVGGKMQPSPRALVLYEELKPLLGKIERTLQPPIPFNAATSTRTFRVSGPVLNGVMAEMLALMYQEAPNAGLEWVSPSTSTVSDMLSEQIDVGFGNANFLLPEGLKATSLEAIPRRVFARKGHPINGSFSTETWLSWPHIVVQVPAAIHGTVGECITNQGLQRSIGFHAPDWSSIALTLLSTNMLANHPALAFVEYPNFECFDIFEPPLPLPQLAFRVFWNATLDGDPATKWIREKLKQALDKKISQAHSKWESRVG
ncbi:MAG: LysR family transcriptional regulator [Granulosicoccus sp.]